ncbi:MAG: glycoside hydrolase family 172 protein [Bacteroidales bacterium]
MKSIKQIVNNSHWLQHTIIQNSRDHKLFIWTLTLVAFMTSVSSCSNNNEVSLDLLLSEMTDRRKITLYPEPGYKLKQFSSYDRNSVSADEEGWFANADYTQFIRKEENKGRREYVLFDHKGPGAVVRWWMTFAGEGSHRGIIRVYIDNNEDPVIEDNVLEVLSGELLAGAPLSTSVSPDTDYHMRGHNLYLPIPYSRHCKITYECDSIRINEESRQPSIYYNINYRDYEEGTSVESLSAGILESSKDITRQANETLLTDITTDNKAVVLAGEIKAGESLEYTESGKGKAIDHISLKLESADINQALRSTVLEIIFDDIKTVWVPVGDFFGTGFELHTYNTWYSSVKNEGIMESRWLMPFRKKVEVRIHNLGKEKIAVNADISFDSYKWKKRSMYFGASWHEYHNIRSAGSEHVGGSGRHSDINFIDIKGRGVYAGDAVTVFNTADAWWGEGDEKIYVDNDTFPSSIGTGTEDYYGYAWCRPEKFSHPFIAQPSGEGNFHPGMTVNMRYRTLDAIPFRDSISANIELWHWAPATINYALTSYYYVQPAYTVNISPDTAAVRMPVPRKRSDIIKPVINNGGILEGEHLEVMVAESGTAETQYITSWDWSNKGQLWWRNGEAGDKMFTRFIIPETAVYNVKARLSKARDYGILSFEINGNRAGKIFNAYTEGEEVVEIPLGRHILPEGDNIFTVSIEGSDKRAKPGNMAGIDCLIIEKQ